MSVVAKRALLLTVSILMSLVLAEAGLRVWFWTKGIGREDIRGMLERSRAAEMPKLEGGSGLFGLLEPSPYPNVIYQLKPHLKGIFRRAPLETNRFGLRGPEIEKEKPPNTYRIVGLGDSHMFGWGVGQKEFYLARLEEMLNRHAERGWRFETLNFAAPGYNTAMEVATFEHRALEFSPDLVLLHFIGNDIYTPHFLAPPPSLAPSSWYLVELFRGLFRSHEAGNEIEGDDLAGDSDIDESAEAAEPEEEPSGDGRQVQHFNELGGRWACRAAMIHLAELARERGIPAIMFQLGESSALRRWAHDRARQAGLDTYDARPTFLAVMRELGKPDNDHAAFKDLYSGLDTHPNAFGHEAYARALFCKLEEMKIPHLLPAPEQPCP